jgi:hypothetical protein
MDEDLNQLFWFDVVPLMPRLQPRYWPFAPQHAPAFEVYRCQATVHKAFTTLDTYVAPAPAQKQSYYSARANQGNGTVLWGNAPTSGVYTGVQKE